MFEDNDDKQEMCKYLTNQVKTNKGKTKNIYSSSNKPSFFTDIHEQRFCLMI